MKTRYSESLGCDAPDYPPTYGGMVEHLRDDPSEENYRWFTGVVRKARNLSRLCLGLSGPSQRCAGLDRPAAFTGRCC